MSLATTINIAKYDVGTSAMGTRTDQACSARLQMLENVTSQEKLAEQTQQQPSQTKTVIS